MQWWLAWWAQCIRDAVGVTCVPRYVRRLGRYVRRLLGRGCLVGYVGIVVGVARKEKDMIMSRLRGSVITSGCLPWASAVEISHHRALRMARLPSRYGVAWA